MVDCKIVGGKLAKGWWNVVTLHHPISMLLPIWHPVPFMPHKKYVAEMQNYKNNKNMKNTQKKKWGTHVCPYHRLR